MRVLIKEFKEHEFACKCGQCGLGYAQMQDSTLSKVFTARKRANVPFVIRSAFRCQAHNAKVSKTKNSAHTRGFAVDIEYGTMDEGFKILKALIDAGFPRVGINFDLEFIHADDDPSLPPGLFGY